MGVGRPQKPIQVGVLDDTDGRREVPTGARQAHEQVAVRPLVMLAGMLLEHDVDPGQRSAEDRLQHVDEMRPLHEAQVDRGDDEQSVPAATPNSARTEGRSAAALRVRGARVQVEAR